LNAHDHYSPHPHVLATLSMPARWLGACMIARQHLRAKVPDSCASLNRSCSWASTAGAWARRSCRGCRPWPHALHPLCSPSRATLSRATQVPSGLLPVLELDGGPPITESAVIMSVLEEEFPGARSL